MSDAPGGMDEATLAGIEQAHRPHQTAVDERPWCLADGKDWPCPTALVVAEVRRLSAALAEQQRENERQADLIAEFRKRNESQDRIRKRLISERDALQVDNSVQFDRAEAAEAALADLRAKVIQEIDQEWLRTQQTPGRDAEHEARLTGKLNGLSAARSIVQSAAATLAAAPAGEPAPCCDLHGSNCEPPSELCCGDCTEAHHGMHADPPDYDRTLSSHHDGSKCVLDPAAPSGEQRKEGQR